MQEIEEKLNDEVKKTNKELKRRQKLEVEFKCMNMKRESQTFTPFHGNSSSKRVAS